MSANLGSAVWQVWLVRQWTTVVRPLLSSFLVTNQQWDAWPWHPLSYMQCPPQHFHTIKQYLIVKWSFSTRAQRSEKDNINRMCHFRWACRVATHFHHDFEPCNMMYLLQGWDHSCFPQYDVFTAGMGSLMLPAGDRNHEVGRWIVPSFHPMWHVVWLI